MTIHLDLDGLAGLQEVIDLLVINGSSDACYSAKHLENDVDAVIRPDAVGKIVNERPDAADRRFREDERGRRPPFLIFQFQPLGVVSLLLVYSETIFSPANIVKRLRITYESFVDQLNRA